MANLTYIGHSAFFIENSTCGILIDPFISQNPLAKFDMNNKKITDIIVTHGHGDHLGDAVPISKSTGAVISAIFELANWCAAHGANANPVQMGGLLNYNWGKLRFVPAFHSNSTPDGKYAGMPTGVILEINGKKIYHCGDTCLSSEMKVIGEVYKPDIMLVPIGSHFTMDIDDAVIAAEWTGAKTVIPMHYNTFPPIQSDPQMFKTKLKDKGIECIVLAPGEKISI